jgi:hypothetical protein
MLDDFDHRFLRQFGVFHLVRATSFSLALLLIKRLKKLNPVEYRRNTNLSFDSAHNELIGMSSVKAKK